MEDGSTLWDIWSLGAMILECDMDKDEYMRINSERGSLQKAEKVTEDKNTCRNLRAIVRGTVLCGRMEDMIRIEEIIKLLEQVSFRKKF